MERNINEHKKMITTSAPGRICLFGEHQDYLHLPVITAAIDLRISISGQPRRDRKFVIDLPDVHSREQFTLPLAGEELFYIKERDYFRSVLNVLQRHGAKFDRGYDCIVQGDIPINSGTSSSSALCVAWTRFLTKISSAQKAEFTDPAFIGKIAFLAEVEEFGEPGGMMDQNASAVGGILYQDFNKPLLLKKLPTNLRTFVLGDSLEPKDTMRILTRVKFGVQNAVKKIQSRNRAFRLESATLSELEAYRKIISKEQIPVLRGAVMNRDITRRAVNLFEAPDFDERHFGRLLNEHQNILAELLKISTPKIDRMLQAAMEAGAYGGKINGSGGGGCMFVYAPENPQKVAEAIERESGRTYIINTDDGSK